VTSSGSTIRQLAWVNAASRCEPGPPRGPTIPVTSRSDGVNTPRRYWRRPPGEDIASVSRARTRRRETSVWPSAVRIAGRRNASNDTSTLTGLPGSVTTGTPCLRPARLHRDLRELDTLAGQRVLHHFVRARADAAGSDQQVGVGQLRLDDLAELLDVVDHAADDVDLAAEAADRRREHHAVGLVDLAVPQRGGRVDQLGAGRGDHHPQRPVHQHLGEADRGGQAQLGVPEHGPGVQRDAAFEDVLAGVPDVRAFGGDAGSSGWTSTRPAGMSSATGRVTGASATSAARTA
jgi:hypothetical protein